MILRGIALVAVCVGQAARALGSPPQESEKIDVLPAFPPLTNLDDTHPPKPGTFELNELALGDIARGGRVFLKGPYLDINYGTQFGKIKNLQLKIESGYGWLRNESQDPYQGGISNLLLGVKWMFFSNEGREAPTLFRKISLAIYPQVSLAPSVSSVRRGLAEDGVRYTFPFLATKTITVGARPIGITFNVGGEHGGLEPDDVYWVIGGGTRIDGRTSIMASFSDETSLDSAPNKLVQVQVGTVRKITNRFKIFGMAGKILNVRSNVDGVPHFVWALGIQIIAGKEREE